MVADNTSDCSVRGVPDSLITDLGSKVAIAFSDDGASARDSVASPIGVFSDDGDEGKNGYPDDENDDQAGQDDNDGDGRLR